MNSSDNDVKNTYAFQAEINQLLSLIINTFYSSKDIFLRELISNASDALDKIRYKSLTNPGALDSNPSLNIKIVTVPSSTPGGEDVGQLIIEDSGVGMTRDDLIQNLGTIAHSGTRAFMEALSAGKADVSLIGQFGVGFYSAFLVAKSVTVYSKHDDSPSIYRWQSNASGTFTIDEVDAMPNIGDVLIDTPLRRGTRIVLDLKEDCKEYVEERKIREVVRQHSEYCSFPILLLVSREETVEKKPQETMTEEAAAADATVVQEEDGKVEDITTQEGEEPKKEVETVVRKDFEELNKVKPVWQRKPEEVTQDEHNAFYKSLSNDWEDPIAYKHFHLDGQIQFKCVIYLPKRPPMDLFQKKKQNNIRLYVKKVFVTDQSEDLVPEWLSFVKGVVDSDDLPLNVSREMLQQNKVMKIIRKSITKRCIDLFCELQSEAETGDKDKKDKYRSFYEAFSKSLKLGVHSDSQNREKLIDLLRFSSTKSNETNSFEEDTITLKTYVSRMKEDQTDIYYLIGESLDALKMSPLLERLRNMGLEVILMTDPIDEYMMQAVQDYNGKKLVNIAKDGLKLPGEEEDEMKELQEKYQTLCNNIKSVLSDKVTDVKVSKRLDKSPCVLVSESYGWTANMERIIKAQALRDSGGMFDWMSSRKIMEINPNHPIWTRISSKSPTESVFKNTVNIVYETAVISSGFSLGNPALYASRIFRILSLEEEEEEENEEPLGSEAQAEDVTPQTPEQDVKLEELD